MAHADVFDPRRNKSSDLLFSFRTDTSLRFNPVRDGAAHMLCDKLGVQCKKPLNPGPEMGPPCKSLATVGDGNCLFRALSQAVCGTEEYHGTLRNFVVNQLLSNPSVYRYTIPRRYPSVTEYLKGSGMETLGVWATEVEIQAAADALGVSVYTYYSDRWLQYKCQGLRALCDQGIYLVNRGAHFEPVTCVQKKSESSDFGDGARCYSFCKEQPRERFTQRILSEERNECAMELDEKKEARGLGEGPSVPRKSVSGDNYAMELAETKDAPGLCEGPSVPRKSVSGENYAVESSLLRDSCYKEDEVEEKEEKEEEEEEASRREELRQKLEWSTLNKTWNYFLKRMDNRWWDFVPERTVVSILVAPEVPLGSIAVTAYLGNKPGGVCSCTVKREYSVFTIELLIKGDCYVFGHSIASSGFATPTQALTAYFGYSFYSRLLLKPECITRNTRYFSVTHVAEQMGYMMLQLGKGWSGTCDERKVKERIETLRSVLKIRRAHTLSAVMHCAGKNTLGYLFEVISARGRRSEITFDRRGFSFGTESRYTEIASILAYFSGDFVNIASV